MTGPKPVALPLGDIPIFDDFIIKKVFSKCLLIRDGKGRPEKWTGRDRFAR